MMRGFEMKGNNLFSAFILSYAVSINSGYAETTGNALRAFCANSASPDYGICIGYISGALDAIRATNNFRSPKLFCEPYGVDGTQLVELSKHYLTDHPDQTHFVAAQLIELMMRTTFPCSTK